MQTVTYLLGVRGLVQLRGPERTITLKFEIELWREATDAVDAALNDREHDRRSHGGECEWLEGGRQSIVNLKNICISVGIVRNRSSNIFGSSAFIGDGSAVTINTRSADMKRCHIYGRYAE